MSTAGDAFRRGDLREGRAIILADATDQYYAMDDDDPERTKLLAVILTGSNARIMRDKTPPPGRLESLMNSRNRDKVAYDGRGTHGVGTTTT